MASWDFMVIEYSYFVQSICMFGFIEIIVNNISQQAFKGCDYVSLEALTFGTFITWRENLHTAKSANNPISSHRIYVLVFMNGEKQVHACTNKIDDIITLAKSWTLKWLKS